jgi:hypothetical protein
VDQSELGVFCGWPVKEAGQGAIWLESGPILMNQTGSNRFLDFGRVETGIHTTNSGLEGAAKTPGVSFGDFERLLK